jgi:hypothetical protein
MLPLTLMGGSATELSVTGSCHGRGGDKTVCPLGGPGTGQYCSVSILFLFGTSPGWLKLV